MEADFVAGFEKKVKETIKKYELAGKKERIIVACSGGEGFHNNSIPFEQIRLQS